LTDALEAHLRHQIEHSQRFFWHRLRWQAVRHYLPEGPFEMIDVGAGAGLLGTFLARDRPEATYRFVEPIDSLRESLRSRYGAHADAGSDESYRTASLVTLLDVLEHQRDDHGFMKGLVSKMAPGSTLLVTVPALERLWSQWDVALGHFRRYDKPMLLRCLDDLPLVVQEASFLFPELLPLAMIRRRRHNASHGGDASEDAEFPEIPRVANETLYLLGRLAFSMRRRWPAGTSLFLSATVER